MASFSSGRVRRPLVTGESRLTRLDAEHVRTDARPLRGIVATITPGSIRAQSRRVAFAWRCRQSGEHSEATPEDSGPSWERARITDNINLARRRDADNLALVGLAGQAKFSQQRRPQRGRLSTCL